MRRPGRSPSRSGRRSPRWSRRTTCRRLTSKCSSVSIQPRSRLAAPSDDKLKGSVFLVSGHTDAKGSDAYNLSLSDQRAKSVAEFLIENFHIDPKQLVAIGFGEEKLKNRENPLAAENRRQHGEQGCRGQGRQAR